MTNLFPHSLHLSLQTDRVPTDRRGGQEASLFSPFQSTSAPEKIGEKQEAASSQPTKVGASTAKRL